jgi:hypothetical protein
MVKKVIIILLLMLIPSCMIIKQPYVGEIWVDKKVMRKKLLLSKKTF